MRAGSIILEMLARDRLPQYPGPGGDLVRVVERSLAHQLGMTKVRMEALQEVARHYDDVLGYKECGKPYQDPGWRLLTPKRELLPRRS